MSQPEAPKIEFPCDYPIKVIGDNGDDFQGLVVSMVRKVAPDFDESTVSLNASRNGTFVSVRFSIRATGKEQLATLHQTLMASKRVKMVI
ncbi:MAG: DUF493 domain-containing protein [Oleiphilaceae bacterium]|nr:DUF493 domain-containing protein [Oleiphilaceae bacterium]